MRCDGFSPDLIESLGAHDVTRHHHDWRKGSSRRFVPHERHTPRPCAPDSPMSGTSRVWGWSGRVEVECKVEEGRRRVV